MTWARVKETGSGKLDFRLVIEGCKRQWVTSSRLAVIRTDDRYSYVGLKASSIRFSEVADLTSSRIKSSGFDVQIVDVDGQATDEFAHVPDHTTWLTQDMSTADTTIHCLYNLGWVVGQTIHIGTECMTVATLPDSISATVNRGTRNTTVQAHFTDDGSNLRAPEITTDKPSCIEGRRAFLYAYGDEETGNGTLIFTGVCATDARLTKPTLWEITIDPITTLLEQDTGGDLEEPVAPRGIHYYIDNKLLVKLTRLSGATFSSATSTDYAQFYLYDSTATDGTYFFENQDEFCSALNALIVSATSTWATPLTATGAGNTPCLQAVPTTDGSWTFQYQTGSTPYWLIVDAESAIDPSFYTNHPASYTLRDAPQTTLILNRIYTLVPRQPSAVYRPLAGLGTVPRGTYGHDRSVGVTLPGGIDWFRYLYLGGSGSLAGAGAFASGGFTIEWPDGSSSRGASTTRHSALSVASGTRRLEVQDWGFEDPADEVMRVWTADMLPQIKLSRTTARGSIADYITEICNTSADGANAGYSPLLTSSDVNLTEIQENVAEAANGFPFLNDRIYVQASTLKLSDVICPELLMLGLVPCMDANGKLTFRKCRQLAGTDTISGTVNASKQLTSVNAPTWERFQNGCINDITISTGWDPKEDKYNGTTFRVRDVGSYSRNKLARKITIEPKSYCGYDVDRSVSYRDIVPVLEPILGLFGYPYDVVTIPVPLSMFDVLIGDNVLVSSVHLPNSATGRRGVTNAVGIVTGREWHPSQAHGVLTILISLLNIAGYTPTSRITSTSLVSGTTYDITIATGSQPTGYATIDDWALGDEIQVAAIDSASPTVRTGTITTPFVSGTATFRVVLSGALPAGTLNVDYVSAADVQAAQELYCFQANDSAIIEAGTGDVAARRFAS
jgi:hypothetical protein